jgi:hypothetical protein
MDLGSFLLLFPQVKIAGATIFKKADFENRADKNSGLAECAPVVA